ncbi:MAG TPA: sodium:solute symporter [Sedimentisphaerales bacterium]|nr:sodium:solute symporter [Phycisphaerae bacterium]HON91581.1 sodium:solute symporter [Sedimentisphaerales bacterium]HQI28592.1 sodium:solute symporter [Sedimentisphaerales bacterium]
MDVQLHVIDITILVGYCLAVVGMGLYYTRKCRTAEEFMVAGRSIPAWAAGLAIMSTYTSSISYIATPGKAYDTNWHPLIFSLAIFPVAWLACRYAVPYYRRMKLVSVYEFLEERIGPWGRVYAAMSFLLYIVGRTAVILYLVSLLLSQFLDWPIETIIVVIGVVTILYTLLGGMEAVIWTDVMQSVIMIGGVLFCVANLSWRVFSGPEPLIGAALDAGKFSLGSWDLSLSSRTIWVMIIYGVTENLRNLLADQNFVQKYSSVPTERQARRSIWIAMLIYIPMTVVFLYIGTALFAFYSGSGAIAKGDQAFPYFIATQLPVGMKGLILAAILAAAMSTVDSGLNCSATVLLVDFYKRYVNPRVSERASLLCLRAVTVGVGLLGTGLAIPLISLERSTLDIWWQISGIFGGIILALFVLGILRVRLKPWQCVVVVCVNLAVILWGSFARGLPAGWEWAEPPFDSILAGAAGTAVIVIAAMILGWSNRHTPVRSQNVLDQENS